MPGVKKLEFDTERVTTYDVCHTDDRYKTSPVTAMGPSFLVFDESGSAGRMTLNYEELLYVVAGRLRLTVFNGDQAEVITGNPGDVIAIPAGSELDYSGEQGTRVYVVFSPLDWEERLVTDGS